MFNIIKRLAHPSRKDGWTTLIAIALLAMSRPSFAFITCSYTTGSSISSSMPLQGANITVGEDTPNGTVLFKQSLVQSSELAITCDPNPTAYNYQTNASFTQTPLPLSSWSGSPYGGKTYETGVPGIGVAIWTGLYGGHVLPAEGLWGGTVQANVENTSAWNAGIRFDISFIKTGPISAGVIQGGNLPTFSWDFVIPENGQMNLMRVNFLGSINVVAGTCRTPDVMVNLGKHEISKKFSGIGSGTDWVKYNITLLDCPTFYGTLNDGNNTYSATNGDVGVGTHTANALNLNISPNTTVLDATNGVISLNPNSSSASGVGIQVATLSGNSDSGAPVPWDLNNTTKAYIVGQDGASTRVLRFAARYIQTEEAVTPGPANSSLSFIINYL